MGRRWQLARRLERVAGGVRWTLKAAAGGLALVGVSLTVIVVIPPLAVDPRGLSRNDWLTHVDSLRATMLQCLGGLALLGTLYFSARTLRLNRRGQLTERFGKAVEQLGSDSMAVRVGGIYALEQIGLDSDELHWPVMQVLTAYLREHAAARPRADVGADGSGRRVPADHQAIATVIGNRRIERDPGDRLELSGTDLSGVRWIDARLERVRFNGAHLEGAEFDGARLEGASFRGAHLQEAILSWADLRGATLDGAHLELAKFEGTHLEGASMVGAHLEQAVLVDARGLALGQLRCAAGARLAQLPEDLARRLDEAAGSAAEQPPGSPPEPGAGKSP